VPALRNIIKRIDWDTNLYTWDLIQDHGAAQTATDGATLNFSDAVFSQSFAKMSYFYHLGLITNPAIQASRALLDVVATRVGGGMKQVLRKEGSVIYNGDPNNAQNPGLLSALQSSATFGYAGNGATLSASLLSSIDVALRGNGYTPGVWVCSPGIYSILEQAAFNKVRFLSMDDAAQIGYSFAPTKSLMFNGIPVIMDKYAETPTAVSNVTMAGSGVTFTFPNNNVYISAGQDFAGTTWAAPTFTVSGSAVASSAYSITGNTVTFNTAPGATPHASYTYGKDNIYCLSLDPEDLVIAEQMGPTVEMDLAKPVQQDAIPFRIKEYSVLAVRNPLAHVVASNIVLPATPILSF